MTVITSSDEVPPDAEATEASDDAARALELGGRLTKRLDERASDIETLRAYRDGEHPMAFATKKWRETFGREFGMIVDNWCRIVVDAAVERMSIQGFRFGTSVADGDTDAQSTADDAGAADADAHAIWQRNRMDVDSDLVHTEMLSTGYSYVLVWPDEDDPKLPVWSVEDPLHTIVQHDPANRRKRIAGFKRWRELDGTWRAMLFTPDRVWSLVGGKSATPSRWAVIDAQDNLLGIVPIVEFLNDPDIYGRGASAFESGIPLNDAINKLMADMMVASEFTSFRQRVLIGVEIPTLPDGSPAPVLTGANRWIGLEAAVDAEGHQVTPTIQELQTSDLSSYVNGIEVLTQHFAALTRTPPHYLLAKLVNVSADALIASQDGLIARTRRGMRFAGESWEEGQRISFLIMGDTRRASDWSAETMWADPETTSEAQRVDALTKLKAIGVPQRALWELDGRSPQTIKRWETWAAEEARIDALRVGIGAGGLATDAPPPAPSDDGTASST